MKKTKIVVTYWKSAEMVSKASSNLLKIEKGIVHLDNGREFNLETGKQVGGKRRLTKSSRLALQEQLQPKLVSEVEKPKTSKPKIKMPSGRPAGSKKPAMIIRCHDVRNFSLGKWSETANKGEGGYQFDGYYSDLNALIDKLRQRLVAKKSKDVLTVDSIQSAWKDFGKMIEASVDSAMVEVDPKFIETWKQLAKLQDKLTIAGISVDQAIAEAKKTKKAKKDKG